MSKPSALTSTPFSRRSFLVGAAGAAGMLALTACSTGAGTGSSSGGSGKLTIMANGGEITPDMIKTFTAETDIQVTFLEYDQTKLNAMFAAGNAPDLIRDSGGTSTPYIGNRGLALPLDDYIAKSSVVKESDLNVLGDVWKWDGSKQGSGPRYGLMKDYSQDAMFWYNEAFFSEGGVALPTNETPLTYDDLIEIGKALTVKAGDGTVSRYGMWTQSAGVESIATMMATADGRLFADDLRSADFSSPEALAALDWFVKAGQARIGYSVVDVNPDGWDGPPFNSGKISMSQAGYWFAGQVASSEDAPGWARLAPAPLLGSTRFSPTTAATGHWISAKSKNPDEAWAFLEYFTAGQPAKDRAKAGWGLPALNSLRAELPQELEYQKLALATQTNEEKYAGVLQFSPFIQVAALTAVIQGALPAAIEGSITVGQLADQITSETNELIKQGIELAEG